MRTTRGVPFQISEDISGVNMRLAAGGIRELHRHQQAE